MASYLPYSAAAKGLTCWLGNSYSLNVFCETDMVYLECPTANIHPNSIIVIKYRNN